MNNYRNSFTKREARHNNYSNSFTKRKDNHNNFRNAIIVMVIIFMTVGVFVSIMSSGFLNQRMETCTVTGKESVTISANDSHKNQYRVYTEDCGTLTVQDTLVGFRFDSADLYGQIKDGETYEFKLGGYRQGLLNMFPNILSMEKV